MKEAADFEASLRQFLLLLGLSTFAALGLGALYDSMAGSIAGADDEREVAEAAQAEE